MAKIFISYARKDAGEIADELADQLRAKDHEVFLDVQSIRAGARWRSELSRRIKWSNLIVVLVTEGSNASDYVYQEIREAEQHGKTIIPVKVGDAPLPVHLRGTWHAITLQDDNLDVILLEIQSALLHSSGSRTVSPMLGILGFTIIILIGVLAFIFSQGGDENQNTGNDTGTSVAVNIADDATSEITNTSTNTPTNTPELPTATDTSEPPTATPTDTPTLTNTPTVTMTPTPRPTNTVRPTRTPVPTLEPGAELFSATFDNESTSGLRFNRSEAQVVLIDDDNYGIECLNNCDIYFGRVDWQNYSVEYRFRVLDGLETFESSGSPMIALYFYMDISDEWYGYVQSFMPRWSSITLENVIAGIWSRLETDNTTFLQQNEWYWVRVERFGDRIEVYFNETLVAERIDDTYQQGTISLGVWPGAHVQFDDITVRYLGE